MNHEHLRVSPLDEDGNEIEVDLDFHCDHCGAAFECIIGEPNSFTDLHADIVTWFQEHAGCEAPKRKKTKKKPKTEPDAMASAQAAVLRERMGKLA